MNGTRQDFADFRRTLRLTICLFILFAVKATSLPSCEDEICIDLEHLSGRIQFSIPPTEINFVLELPKPPPTGVKVYVHLMRANTAGQFESIFSTSTTMFGKQKHSRWDPSRTPYRKRGDRFVLAATLDPQNRTPESITREFSIKWSENR